MTANEVIHISTLEKVITKIEDALQSAKFNFRNGGKSCLLLYLSALENARAFVDISQKPYAYASVANARSALEALIDAVTTIRDEHHVERMRQEFLFKKRNALSSAVKMVQKLGCADPAPLQRQLNGTNIEIDSIKSSKLPKLRREEQITEYVDDSGSLSVQWSILCDVSHNNINSLAVRHLDLVDGKESIVLYVPLDKQLAETIIVTLSSLLVDVGLLVGEFISSDRDEFTSRILSAQSEIHWIK